MGFSIIVNHHNKYNLFSDYTRYGSGFGQCTRVIEINGIIYGQMTIGGKMTKIIR